MTWPTAQLGRLVRIVGGGTPSKKRCDFWDGPIPWVSPKDMGNRELHDARDHISDIAVRESTTQVVPVGSVLIVVRSGILARRVPIGIARTPVALNQDLKAFLPGGPLLPDYLAYALEAKSDHVLNNCVKRGATVHSVDIGKLQRLVIPIPTPSEQQRIVEILDQAGRLRRLRAEADAKAARIPPALFITMFGNPRTNPMGWNFETLGELAVDLRYGTSKRCHTHAVGVPVLRIPNIIQGEVDTRDLKYCELPENELERLVLLKGDLLFVRTNGNPDYVGRCAAFEEESRYSFASYLIRARVNTETVEPVFLVAYLRTPLGRRAMAPFIRTTAGQSNINTAGLRQIRVPLPPMRLQRHFCDILRVLRVIDSRRHRQAIRLDGLLQNLLHRAFSGDLTASWRDAHMAELLQEMEHQAKTLSATARAE